MKNIRLWVGALVAGAAGAAWSAEIAFQNGDFERYDAQGRAVAWSVGPGFTVGRGLGHNANGGVQFESAEPLAPRLTSVRQKVTGFEPGDWFEMSALVKKENFKKGKGDGFALVLEWYDASGKWMCAPAMHGDRNAKDGEWDLWKGSGLVPQNAAYGLVHFYVCGGGSGKVALDNVTVVRLSQDPVAFVCSSAYRDVAAQGKVRFLASLNVPRTAKAASALFRWRGADGRERTRAAAIADAAATLELAVDELAPGEQSVVCELVADGRTAGTGACRFTRVDRLPARRVWIDAHKRCIVDDRPFFPLGMYWGRTTDETLALYKKGAFNCVMPYGMMTLATLDKLQAAGIRTLSCVNDLKIGEKELLRRIEEQRRHPALLGWYVMDEAGVGQIPKLVKWYEFIRQHDPDHPAYAVQDRIYDLRQFMPAADVFGLDPYPVATLPLKRVTDFQRGAKQAFFDARALWNVPQTFAWKWYRGGKPEDGRFPTTDEIRSMCWQHVAGGANGLISFCFYNTVNPAKEPDPAVRADNFGRVCTVSHEVAKMIPVMLSVEPAPAATPSSDDLVCRAWAKDGALYVLACNVASRPCEAAVDLASGAWKMAGTELGAPATMAGPRRIAFRLGALGVSFVRLAP